MSERRHVDRLTRARPSGRPEVQSYHVAPTPNFNILDGSAAEPSPVETVAPRRLPPIVVTAAGAIALADILARLVF